MSLCLTARGNPSHFHDPHLPPPLPPSISLHERGPLVVFKGRTSEPHVQGRGLYMEISPASRTLSLRVPFHAGDFYPWGPAKATGTARWVRGLSLFNPGRPLSGAARGWGVARVGGGRPHSPAIHGPDSHGHLDRCHSSSRPGPPGLPPGLRPAAAGHSSDSARAPAHFPLTRPSAGADLELLGGHTCQATEHAQSGSGPRDPRTGVWQLPTAGRGGARKSGPRLLGGHAPGPPCLEVNGNRLCQRTPDAKPSQAQEDHSLHLEHCQGIRGKAYQ